MRPFSKRNKEKPLKYKYEISRSVRTRILQHTFDFLSGIPGHGFSYGGVMLELGKMIRQNDGEFCYDERKMCLMARSTFVSAEDSSKIHFEFCDTDKFLDVLEYLFEIIGSCARHGLVVIINEIFQDENIGYEFTPYINKPIKPIKPRQYPPVDKPFCCQQASTKIDKYPQAIRKENKLFEKIVSESRHWFLMQPLFMPVSEEILASYTELKNGEYDDVGNKCRKAVESLLKIIIVDKKWNKQSKIEDKALGSLASIYYEHAKGGSVLKKLKNPLNFLSHGQIEKPKLDKYEAEYLLEMTVSSIIFIVKSVKYGT